MNRILHAEMVIAGLVMALAPIPAAGAARQPGDPARPLPALALPEPVTRADLAARYLEVDRAFMRLVERGIADEKIAEYNRRFDQVTGLFFTGAFGAAVQQLDELARAMEPEERRRIAGAVLAGGFAVRVDRITHVRGAAAWPMVRARSFGVVMGSEPKPVRVMVRADGDRQPPDGRVDWLMTEARPGEAVAVETSIDRLAGAVQENVVADPAAEAGGEVRGLDVWVLADGYIDAGQARIWSVERSFDEERREGAARLEAIEARGDEMGRAVAIARARTDLLADAPDLANSAKFRADYSRLVPSVRAEIAELEGGRNPYRRRTGELWRPVVIGERTVAARVFAPAAAAGDVPMPLVIALHGAGGDESMFMDGYGDGEIRRLAERLGFIVIAPQTEQAASPAVFDAIVEQVAADYAVDRARVYVIGHSLGGGAAAALASSRAGVVAAVVCICGGARFMEGRDQARPLAPTLVMGAALDPVIPAARLRAGVEAARAKGLPVEYRHVEHYGHTLVVGAKLEEAVKWLLARQLNGEVGHE